MHESERRKRFRWFREFRALALPYWTSNAKWTAIPYVFGAVAAILAVVYFNVWMNRWYRRFFDTAGSMNGKAFFHDLIEYAYVMVAWTLINRFGGYLRRRLEIHWREWMTRRFMDLWMSDQKHYFCGITQNALDNPDQRISQDISIFVGKTIWVVLNLFEKLLTLITFIGIMWQLSGTLRIPLGHGFFLPIPGYLMWCSLLFAIISNVFVYRVGRVLVPLEYEQQHLEANYRAKLIKVQEYGENIAFLRGEKFESTRSDQMFSRIVKNYLAIIKKFFHLEVFDDLHRQVRWVFPYLVAAPRLLSGAIKIGGVMQIANAFEKVEDSVAFLVSSFKTIADWRSATRRLADFEESLKRSGAIRQQSLPSGKAPGLQDDPLSIQGLDVFTPGGRMLLKNLCLELQERERAFVVGKSGLGKSTVMRIIAGLWPYYEGQVATPDRGSSVFLPQTAYMPEGTLRDTLSYPDVSKVTDEILCRYLGMFKLTHLCAKLDVEDDWQKRLSPGERQRIALIRALLQKPKWLFLDESTSSLDLENQASALSILSNELPDTAILCITHHPETLPFQGRVIDIEETSALLEPV